jgi:MinD superfamily P-loop ATPase
MKIVVASGKGGTGKSTFSANFAYSISRQKDLVLVDCDVEEPNLHLFFPTVKVESEVTVPVPVFDYSKCDFCGKCGDFCQYGAIAVLKDKILFFKELCHSCGGCQIVCPRDAITEKPRVIGHIWDGKVDDHLRLITGVINEGEANGIPAIHAAKEAAEGNELVIYDASPGTACPVIETMEDSDFCVLVTESTPFGLHDLELAVHVVKMLGIPAGVIINRSDGKDQDTEEFCSDNGLKILMKIPFDEEIAAIQNRGGLFSKRIPEWQARFVDLLHDIEKITGDIS